MYKSLSEYVGKQQALVFNQAVFNSEDFFSFFIASVHNIISNLTLPTGFTMSKLTTQFSPCIKCMRMVQGKAQAYRCKHTMDCSVHQQCRCQDEEKCSCLCACKQFTSPSLTRSKVGAVLHLGELVLLVICWICPVIFKLQSVLQ